MNCSSTRDCSVLGSIHSSCYTPLDQSVTEPSSMSSPPRVNSPLAPPVPSVTPTPIKKANKPFLVHQKYIKQQQQELARNPPPPSPRPPRSTTSLILSSTLKTLLLTLLTSLLLSRAITQSWTWGYESKYTNFAHLERLLFPKGPLTLTEIQLSLYDGTNKELPLYLAIDGDVYDVTQGGRPSYGPGGAYHIFAGRDAARGKIKKKTPFPPLLFFSVLVRKRKES